MAQTIRIEELVDQQKIDWFNINLLFWSFLAMWGDGYDITALSFAAPELVKDWGLQPSSLGPAFSASLVGILFGAPFLGYIGDRLGRKLAIISGCFIYGLFTLAIVWATDLNQIIALRFITGIGIGGLMPNTIALSSELSPKRLRATLTVLMFTGITLGSGTPSVVSAWLLPHYGWEVLFVVGGVVPLFIGVCLLFFLPESIKYLALFPGSRSRLLSVARRLRKDVTIDDDAKFVIAHPGEEGRGSGLRQIYGKGMALITPLLWLCFCTALMSNYFLNSWLPLLIENLGIAPDRAAIASGFYNLGGCLGGILISVLMDRFGFMVIAVLFALAVPAIAALGLEGNSYLSLTLFSTLSGITVLGAQFGNNASAGLIYPTAYRSKGVGWAFAIGRFGSIGGPLIGGALIASRMPMDRLFITATIPMIIGTVAAVILARLCYVRFQGFQLDDAAVTPPD